MTEKGVPPQSSQRTVAFWTSVNQTNLLLLFGTYIHNDTSFLVARNTGVAQGDGKGGDMKGETNSALLHAFSGKGQIAPLGKLLYLRCGMSHGERACVDWGFGCCSRVERNLSLTLETVSELARAHDDR